MQGKSLNVKDPEAYRLARELANRTGESMTQAVVQALRARLVRMGPRNSGRDLVEEMEAIAQRVAALPLLDNRSEDEILGYNDRGLFD